MIQIAFIILIIVLVIRVITSSIMVGDFWCRVIGTTLCITPILVYLILMFAPVKNIAIYGLAINYFGNTLTYVGIIFIVVGYLIAFILKIIENINDIMIGIKQIFFMYGANGIVFIIMGPLYSLLGYVLSQDFIRMIQ